MRLGEQRAQRMAGGQCEMQCCGAWELGLHAHVKCACESACGVLTWGNRAAAGAFYRSSEFKHRCACCVPPSTVNSYSKILLCRYFAPNLVGEAP